MPLERLHSLRFIGLEEQLPLTDEQGRAIAEARALVKGMIEERSSYISQAALDPVLWMPAAVWQSAQPFYEFSRGLLSGRGVEVMRLLSQQFSGYALWCMRQGIGTPLPGPDVQELALAVRAHAASPDEEALSRCADLFKRLPEHLRFGPPLQFGEIGWMVDDVLVNHDTWAYWERLELLHRSGLLEWVKTRPSCRILEIGAGYGALAWYLLKVLHNVEYVIVDIPESLAYSAIYLSALVPGRVKFIPNYRFLEMAFAERFDLVINTNSLSELSEAQVRAYSEAISRMLSPGGFFFEQNQDQTGHGWLNAQMILRNYFPACRRLGKPPELPHGFANVWSMDYAGER